MISLSRFVDRDLKLIPQHMALLELRSIVASDPTRRAAIFTDVRSKPSPFERIVRELLIILGKSYRQVEARNAPPAATAASSLAPPKVDGPATLGIQKAEIKRDNVLRPTAKSPLAFLTNSATPAPQPAQSQPAPAQKAVATIQRTAQSVLPEAFAAPIKSAAATVSTATSAVAIPQGSSALGQLSTMAARSTPSLFRPLVRSRLLAQVGDVHLAAWTAEGA